MENNPYSDIINLPHHVSDIHPPMSRESRAAQFSPFAALTGYDDLIDESARETGTMIEPDESVKEGLNRELVFLAGNPGLRAVFTVFVPDAKKDGGEYTLLTGAIKKYDPINGRITLDSGSSFDIGMLLKIDSE